MLSFPGCSTLSRQRMLVHKKEACHNVSEAVTSELQFKAALYTGLNDKLFGTDVSRPACCSSITTRASQLRLGGCCIEENA